jgi:23S rRNA (uracil1939-C5)-methyltransferase
MTLLFKGKVRNLSHKGLGVVDHPDGRTFFVRGTWPGDEGEFLIPDLAEKYSEAKLSKLIIPSTDRVEISCPHRGYKEGECGGCPWMIASYESQLFQKSERLRHALEKRKIFLTADLMKNIIGSPETLFYRNRVQLKTDGKKIGYVSEGTSKLAPIDDCIIMNGHLRELFKKLKDSLPREDYLPGEGHSWSYIDLDDEMGIQDVVLNRRRPFRQGNTPQNEVMKNLVRENFASIPRHFPIIDLFCGSGNFTEVLSQMGFENILAVEVQGSALLTLKEKNLPGVRVLGLDVGEKGAWAKIAKYQPHARAMLLDPPREGLEKRRGLFKYLDNLSTLFYISCELDSFSRDLSDLVDHGWIVKELTPLDLFPHTPHVEVLCHLVKKADF